MNELEQKIYQDVLNEFDHVVEMRRYLHQHPEVSTQEFETQKYIEQELTALGLSFKRVAGTGVYTEIHGDLEGDDSIILRADTDALPIEEKGECAYRSLNEGVMHACGHDGHTASLLGATKILLKNKNLFGGTVRIAFQPGEEVGYGANYFVDEGYLDGASRCAGLHFLPEYDCGKIVLMEGANNASVDWFKIHVEGKSAHVSAPQEGVDALYIAAQLVVSLQALITRRQNPQESLLLGIGKLEAGQAYNIIAKDAYLEGTLRTFNTTVRNEIKKEMEELCEAIAKAYGGKTSIEWKDNAPVVVNDLTAVKEARKVATSIFGEENVLPTRKPGLTGDDMGVFLNKVPGVYAFVGSGNDENPNTRVSLHNDYFDLDEEALKMATMFYCCYAIEYLNGMEQE